MRSSSVTSKQQRKTHFWLFYTLKSFYSLYLHRGSWWSHWSQLPTLPAGCQPSRRPPRDRGPGEHQGQAECHPQQTHTTGEGEKKPINMTHTGWLFCLPSTRGSTRFLSIYELLGEITGVNHHFKVNVWCICLHVSVVLTVCLSLWSHRVPVTLNCTQHWRR